MFCSYDFTNIPRRFSFYSRIGNSNSSNIYFRLLKAIADYDKIEEKLKEMYEGNNNDTLERKEFLPEFYQSVDYINDISNGFERSIQDRIKSERLKQN